MKIRHHQFSISLTFAGLAMLSAAGCTNSTVGVPEAPPRTIGMTIDDSVIKARVKSALFADPDINAFDIKVDVRKGAVQLSGYVANQSEVDRAVSLARNTEGVRDVENNVTLEVGAASIGNKVDDGITTAAVKSALLADSGIHGLQIGVATHKGVVQLSGFVDNREQANRAVAIARGTDGVRDVSNEMDLKK